MAIPEVILNKGLADEVTIFCEAEEYNIINQIKLTPFAQSSNAKGAKLPLITNVYNILERFTIKGYIKSADKLKLRRLMLGHKSFTYQTVDQTVYDGITTELVNTTASRILGKMTMEKLTIQELASEEQDELKITFTGVTGQEVVKTA